MSHHTSHNIIATCHICNTTFQRMSALSSHLDNVDSPTVCWNCSQSFSNVWELNKHEEQCLSSADERSDLASDVELRLSPSPGTSGNSVDYELRRPLDSDDVSTDESTKGSSDEDSEFDAKAAQLDLSDTESDEESNSSTMNPANFAHIASRGNLTLPANTNGICKDCGRGPFSSIKLHLRYCTGYPGRLFQCSCCMAFFPSQEALKEHRIVLYSCEVCGQVFNKWVSQHQHQPSNKARLRVVSFCPDSMPKTCTICKSFFLNEKFFLAHVTRVHTSVVSTKLCIINKPSGLTHNKLPANVATKLIPKSVIKTEQDNEFSVNAAAKIPPNPFIKTEQDDGFLANVAAEITPKPVIKTEQDDRFLANAAAEITPKTVIKTEQDDMFLANVAAEITPKTVIKTEQDDMFLANVAAEITPKTVIETEQDDGFLANVAAEITPKTVMKTEQDDGFWANVATEITPKPVIKTEQVLNEHPLSDHTYCYSEELGTKRPDLACSAPLPTIVALLKNQRQVLTKRTNTRAQRTCRQCGTVLRQPYLAVSHRYLHRGSRSHRCQCGRAFKHRLHLLRHRVQHAEAESYICVNCGNTFTGARLLAEHLRGNTWKTKKCQPKCNMPLACICGHFFYRASAYIWHQMKNDVKSRNL
nr:oocyte zinc finger protein XlCOF28 isoform X15 [Syngnathus scovelli]XP_049587203.1 oocyte zinc finger protein XlCOF28 isoform X16 [Syngnathus scovelli]